VVDDPSRPVDYILLLPDYFQTNAHTAYYAPPLKGGALSDAFVLRLSVAYIGPNSRTERHMKTKIGIEVAHVTGDSDTTFKVNRSKSPGRFTQRVLNA